MKHSASLLILNPQGKRLLLQRGGDSMRFQGYWEFPGGKIDTGESPHQAVLREVREETGLLADVPVSEPLWRTVTANGSVEYSFFVWQPTVGELNVTLSGEHLAFQWVSFTGARKLMMMAPHREFMDRYWLQEQVNVYRGELPHYIAYRNFLEMILNRLKSRWAPLAIVQAREKGLSSFSEKCMRKADKYDDPAHELTDLCGARIIATSTHEVETLIRQIQKLFAVDELDDTSRRHDIAEFGYLSVHFIVHVKEDATEILGVPVPSDIGSRKAEIQVRTMLQHAHSEVTHDRLYKSGFNPPQLRRREAARVAAMLESADEKFAQFVSELDAYVGYYATHLPPEKRRREIDNLKLVLEQEKGPEKKAALALRIARLSRAAWDWQGVISCAEPFIGAASPVSEDLRIEVGHALCRFHQGKPADADFRRGLDLLGAVARPEEPTDAGLECNERDRRATALAWLGWAHSNLPGHRSQARACLERAVELSPENPYHLVAFVELDIIATGTDEHLSLLAPSLRQAAGRCEEHIRAGIEVTRAWLYLAKIRFLLNDPVSAFEALCLGARSTETHYSLVEVVHSFEQLKDAIGTRRPDVDWFCAGARLLSTAKEGKSIPSASQSAWEPLVQQFQFDASLQVTIFAGITSREDSSRLAAYEPFVCEGLAGHKGVLISGGTTAGVCGLAARVGTSLNSLNRGSIQLIGYVPEHVPTGALIDPAFTNRVHAPGTRDFSLMEPIQMWADLLMSGITPGEVRLFCLGGGEISAMELALAWALGARTAVVNDSSVAAQRFASLLNWAGDQKGPGMLLPDDPATLTAFFALDAPIDAKQWEKSGEAVHQAYVKSQKGTSQPNMLPWPLLREDFKHSNRHQAASSVEILHRCGFIVERSPLSPNQIPLVEFSKEQIDRLAEWEHGRWNVERLKNGWRYGEKKDAARKLSPYLVSWQKLPPDIQNYDRSAVRDWPAILAQAGWQIKPA